MFVKYRLFKNELTNSCTTAEKHAELGITVPLSSCDTWRQHAMAKAKCHKMKNFRLFLAFPFFIFEYPLSVTLWSSGNVAASMAGGLQVPNQIPLKIPHIWSVAL
ncbi:hypothetical protein AVEN_217807-1 [Araneus ventricosus]|uniref:Uncharacterized protein n=1 Tax=Araneus ventricosus TaxID=182803 RepID=A0A4Y2TBA7_ARAVE|nr:hypothetical protein AVEN_217807-1 [Araneus ventricosus]